MFLTADYHTHTTFTHGKDRVIDNALSAKEKGLTELGIAEHGFSHPVFGLNKNKLVKFRKECDEATKKTGITVKMGIESNVIGVDGSVDLKQKDYDKFDIFFAGIHKFILYKPKTYFSLFIPNFINSTLNRKDVSSRLIKENTKTFINVIKNNPVDMITHINFCCYANVLEVAKVASDYGTYIELNSKKTHLTDEQLNEIAVKTKVNFLISSDAHSKDRVAEISLVEKLLSRVDIDKERIHNIDGRLPNFRFTAFKEGK